MSRHSNVRGYHRAAKCKPWTWVAVRVLSYKDIKHETIKIKEKKKV